VTRQSRARTNTAILAEGIIALGVVGARVITTRRRDTCACHALQALLMLALLSLPVLPLGALPRSIDAAACMTAVEPMRRHGLPAYGSVRDGWSGGRRPHSTQRGGGGAGAVARACNSAAAHGSNLARSARRRVRQRRFCRLICELRTSTFSATATLPSIARKPRYSSSDSFSEITALRSLSRRPR